MLPQTLNTNEVKDAAGVEVEFVRLEQDGRTVTFAKSGEAPDSPLRLSVKHQESGFGAAKRRRSVVRVDLTSQPGDGGVSANASLPARTSMYLVADLPVGVLADVTGPTDALAYLMSFVASTGATTTILYNGTGNGANALLTGGL